MRVCKSYFANREGTVTIFAVVTFAFLIGFTGLIFDVGRIFNLHSEAQAYADHTALAAAAELDGEGGSIARAVRAVNTGDANSFMDPGFRLTLSQDPQVSIFRLTFLSAIAADPAPGTFQPVTGDVVLCSYQAPDTAAGGTLTNVDCTAADDANARFVLVTTTIETENYVMFPIARFLVPGMDDQASTATQALAGFTREICNFPPMAICNPQENPAGGGGFTVNAGQQILLQTQGASASWAPGDFGFLDLTDLGVNDCSGGGADFLRCLLATTTPNTSCVSADVDMNPGQVTSADVGFNVRFDIFDPPFHNDNDEAHFAPDVNVTKGMVYDGSGNACRLSNLTTWGSADAPTLPAPTEIPRMPRDNNISVDQRIGSGVTQAQLDDYWNTTYNVTTGAPAGVNTRYKLYQEQIATSSIPDYSADGAENGNPTCSTVAPVAGRRNMVVAVINCIENSVSGSANDVPVITFLEMFLTEPAGDPDDSNNHDIYAEVIGTIEPGGADGVLHEYPVLYR